AYGYDDAGRLAIVTENGASVASYTYDVNSNRLSRATASGTQSGTYDDQDRVTSYGGATFSYNANGEIVTKTAPAGVTSYRYDSFGNLVGVTLPNGLVIDYVLDGKNRRVAKKVNGTVTQKFLYSDGLRPIAQLAPDDSIVYQFLYAEKASAPSLIIGNGGTYRVITDHLGSPRGIIDIATGTSLEYLVYDEFGNVAIDTAPGFQPYGFAGGLYDPDTHLVHFGARDYDPSLGRFLTRDPIGFAGGQANVYDYATNDPVNFIDPSGLMPGDKAGADAQQQYVETLTDPNASIAAKVLAGIGGAFASLWTPCTSDATFTVLITAATLGTGSGLAAEEVAATTTPRVFWSGGDLAEQAGVEWAEANGATTLEMTQAGRDLTETTKGLDWLTEARPQWVDASREFAEGASGDVHVFHNGVDGVRLSSVWREVEYPALMNNPDVNIIYHVVY
ncbi:MAG TPA: RHS repeat-associated core domain-containing protein, partial [Thermoanaerobaculia bacterium]|nr:RHS repeat-associated core domain-containing protein [Thermoanaerobaculia bacterium]